MKFSFVSDSWAKSCIFATVFPTLLCCLFWRSKRGVPNPMIALEVFVQDKFTSNSGCLHGPPCFFFYLACCWASRRLITRVEFKFVARQVEDSLVIRAAKLKFVAGSKTRVNFQHCILLRDKLKKNVARINGQHFSSTCLATLFHCKLKHIVARITTFVTNCCETSWSQMW